MTSRPYTTGHILVVIEEHGRLCERCLARASMNDKGHGVSAGERLR